MTPEQKLEIARKEGIEKINSIYSPLINKVDETIDILIKANQNPESYFNIATNSIVNFVKDKEKLINNRRENIKTLETEINEARIKIVHQKAQEQIKRMIKRLPFGIKF